MLPEEREALSGQCSSLSGASNFGVRGKFNYQSNPPQARGMPIPQQRRRPKTPSFPKIPRRKIISVASLQSGTRRKNLNKSQTTAPNTTARKHPVKTPTAGMFNRADTP